MVASVPEFVMRTISAHGIMPQIMRAISSSASHGIPKDVPPASADSIAARIVGWLCPKSAGPQEHTKSTSSRPSQVSTRAPRAERAKNGSPPTPRKARTGELTPPGMSFFDSEKSSLEVIEAPSLLIPVFFCPPNTRPPKASGLSDTANACTRRAPPCPKRPQPPPCRSPPLLSRKRT